MWPFRRRLARVNPPPSPFLPPTDEWLAGDRAQCRGGFDHVPGGPAQGAVLVVNEVRLGLLLDGSARSIGLRFVGDGRYYHERGFTKLRPGEGEVVEMIKRAKPRQPAKEDA